MRAPRLKMASHEPASCPHNAYVEQIRDYPGVILLGEELAPLRGRWHEAFGRMAPLHVEIGFGKGEFLIAMAKRHPDCNFFGWEITYKKVVQAAQKAQRHGLQHLCLTLAHAQFMSRIFAEGEVDAVHVNFPDPWQRARDRKNRLFQGAFLEQLHQVLKPGGMIYHKTDHHEYFNRTRQLFMADGRFVERFATEDLHQSERAEQNIPTNFERLFTRQGLPTYYVELQKK